MQTRATDCASCKNVRVDDTWQSLPLVRSMRGSDLGFITGPRWANRVIEVRRCATCGREHARLLPRTD